MALIKGPNQLNTDPHFIFLPLNSPFDYEVYT